MAEWDATAGALLVKNADGARQSPLVKSLLTRLGTLLRFAREFGLSRSLAHGLLWTSMHSPTRAFIFLRGVLAMPSREVVDFFPIIRPRSTLVFGIRPDRRA